MAAKFQKSEFCKRFWNWIFQKCTFLPLPKKPFCRSLKIQKLPPFFCRSQNKPQKSHYISGYLFTEPIGKYLFVVYAGIFTLKKHKLITFFPSGQKSFSTHSTARTDPVLYVESLEKYLCPVHFCAIYEKLSSVSFIVVIITVFLP